MDSFDNTPSKSLIIIGNGFDLHFESNLLQKYYLCRKFNYVESNDFKTIQS